MTGCIECRDLLESAQAQPDTHAWCKHGHEWVRRSDGWRCVTAPCVWCGGPSMVVVGGRNYCSQECAEEDQRHEHRQ